MEPDPFATLGLAPTNDLAAIKRAYFAALKLHPPHKDPDAFKRVRAAYETLQAPERRATASMSAELAPESVLGPLRARYEAALAAAREETTAAAASDAERVEEFVRAFSALPLRDAVAAARS